MLSKQEMTTASSLGEHLKNRLPNQIAPLLVLNFILLAILTVVLGIGVFADAKPFPLTRLLGTTLSFDVLVVSALTLRESWWGYLQFNHSFRQTCRHVWEMSLTLGIASLVVGCLLAGIGVLVTGCGAWDFMLIWAISWIAIFLYFSGREAYYFQKNKGN